jgi:hypothetical protein
MWYPTQVLSVLFGKILSLMSEDTLATGNLYTKIISHVCIKAMIEGILYSMDVSSDNGE